MTFGMVDFPMCLIVRVVQRGYRTLNSEPSSDPVMAAEIEQLPDRTGFLKFASQPAWIRAASPVYEIPKVAVPCVPKA